MKNLITAFGILTFMGSAFAMSDLDMMLEHKHRSMDFAEQNMLKNLDVESQKLFKDMIANDKREIQQMESLRKRLYPNSPKFDSASEMTMNEEKNGYSVNALIPEINQKDVKVSIVNNALVIRGVQRVQAQTTSKNANETSEAMSSFERMIKFDKPVDAESMKVEFKNDGEVDVHVNKAGGKGI